MRRFKKGDACVHVHAGDRLFIFEDYDANPPFGLPATHWAFVQDVGAGSTVFNHVYVPWLRYLTPEEEALWRLR